MVVKVYNVLGQEVRTLVDRVKPAGSYTINWDGTDTDGKALATGVYFYRLETEEFTKTKKMLLLK